MDPCSFGLLVGIPAGIAGGLVALLYVASLAPRKKCPDCGADLPRMRNTWNSWKVLWTCPECGCGIDSRGKKVEE